MPKQAGVLTINLSLGTANFNTQVAGATKTIKAFGNAAAAVGSQLGQAQAQISGFGNAAAAMAAQLATAQTEVKGLATATKGVGKDLATAQAATRKLETALAAMTTKLAAAQAQAAATGTALQNQAGQANTLGNSLGGVSQGSTRSATALLGMTRGLQGSSRAAAQFLVQVLKLGPALNAAFGVIGVLALGEILVSTVMRVQKFFQDAEEAPRRIAAAWHEMDAGFSEKADELTLKTATLNQELAKLQGKRTNTLAIQLEEARVVADKLAQSIEKDLKEIDALFEKERVGEIKAFFTSQASSKGIDESFLRFQDQIELVNKQGKVRIAEAVKSKDPKRIQAEQDLYEQTLHDRFKDRVDDREKELGKLKRGQDAYNAYVKNPDTVDIFGAIFSGPSKTPEDQTTNINKVIAEIAALKAISSTVGPTFANAATEALIKTTKSNLHNLKLEDDPFNKMMAKLADDRAAAVGKLGAVGMGDDAKAAAQGEAKGLAEIRTVNQQRRKLLEEGRKDQTPLSDQQRAMIMAAATGTAAVDIEEKYRLKVYEGTVALNDRIASLKAMNNAIGQGYTAMMHAQVETEMMAFFKDKYVSPTGPGIMPEDQRKHREGLEEAAQLQNQDAVKKNVESTKEQVELETKLLSVRSQGVRAVELMTIAIKNEQFARHNDAVEAAKLADEIAKLDAARRATLTEEELVKLNRQIDATQRLTEAERKGAEDVRKANLANKYADMKFHGADDRAIAKEIQNDEDAHQKEVLHNALAVGMAYKDRLYNLDQEIAKLKEEQRAGRGTLEITLSLKKLEDERLDTMAQQTLAMGRLQDGIKAFFLEMQREGETTAQIVFKGLESALDKFSDSVAKAITGQKVAWSKMFKELGEEMIRATIKQQIQHGLGRLGPWLGKHFPNIPGFPHPGTHAGGHGRRTIDASQLPHEKSAAQILRSWKQDGQTPQTAFWVQIADTGFPSGGLGPPAIAFPVPGAATPPWNVGGGDASFGSPIAGGTGGFSFGSSGFGDSFDNSPLNVGTYFGNASAEMRGAGGGGYHYTIIQDNRGTDPVLTQQRTEQGIIAAHNAAVSNSMAAQVEFQKRSPM